MQLNVFFIKLFSQKTKMNRVGLDSSVLGDPEAMVEVESVNSENGESDESSDDDGSRFSD